MMDRGKFRPKLDCRKVNECVRSKKLYTFWNAPIIEVQITQINIFQGFVQILKIKMQ